VQARRFHRGKRGGGKRREAKGIGDATVVFQAGGLDVQGACGGVDAVAAEEEVAMDSLARVEGQRHSGRRLVNGGGAMATFEGHVGAAGDGFDEGFHDVRACYAEGLVDGV